MLPPICSFLIDLFDSTLRQTNMRGTGPGNSYACNSKALEKHPIGCLVEKPRTGKQGKDVSMIKHNQYRAVLFCCVTLLFGGCNKQADSTANYKTAINNYYK